MKIRPNHIFAALAAISVIGTASAATIYSDSLIGSDTALNSSTVDTSSAFAGGTAGATWTAGTVNETATGASYANPGGVGETGFLPITITTGYIYTLKATLASTAPGGGWTALGFADSSANGQWHDNGGTKSAWVLLTESGTTSQRFGGPNTSNGETWTTGTGSQVVTITLDTTSAFWTMSADVGGASSSTFTYTTNPTITHVGFGGAFTNSNISNFSLSAVVPEPSAALLGGIGLLALLRRRRA